MRVALFATCLADQLFPDVAVASVKILRHLGVDVDFPEGQTCCGQPAYNAGYHPEAREIAEHHLGVFDGYDYVVIPSGSCGGMVHHYPELFGEAPEVFTRARELSERTFELTTFIRQVLGREEIGADLAGLKVVYHDSCHALRLMGVREAPRALLSAAGAVVYEPEPGELCCGFGGLFSIKLPDISAAMATTRLEGLVETGAGVLTSTDAGCLMQLGGSLQRQTGGPEVRHVAELLWEGIERAGGSHPPGGSGRGEEEHGDHHR